MIVTHDMYGENTRVSSLPRDGYPIRSKSTWIKKYPGFRNPLTISGTYFTFNFRSVGPMDQPAECKQTHTHRHTDATKNITSSANVGGNKTYP